MQITWRTQVKRITIAIIAAVAIAGGVQIANEDASGGTGTGRGSVTADATTPQAPPAAPTPSPSSTKDNNEWS